jgi:hypothetical protein
MLLAVACGFAARADLPQEILGSWQYDGFFYQNHRYPNPNSDLKLTFTFDPGHTSRLFWKRDGTSGFCERKGTYNISGQVLTQTVTWLNPKNDPSCAQDPDMQMPRNTQNRIEIKPGTVTELDLHMDLNGDDFLYILNKVAREPEASS